MSILYSIYMSLLYCKHWEIDLFNRKKNFFQIKRQETDKYLSTKIVLEKLTQVPIFIISQSFLFGDDIPDTS